MTPSLTESAITPESILPYRDNAPGSRHRGTLIAGLALSLLLHAILIASWQPQGSTGVAARDAIELSVQLPQRQASLPEPTSIPKKPHATETLRTEDESLREATTASFTAPQASGARESAALSETPTIDLEAVRSSARRLAAGASAANRAQGDNKTAGEAEEETRLGRSIAKTARPGCVMANANAGLLAPLFLAYHLATDKKGSGCQW